MLYLIVESVASNRLKGAAVMLSIIIFVVLFNSYPATEYHHYTVKRYRYMSISDGKIRGHVADDGEYMKFLGIPYAAPPVRENRFKGPKPPRSWSGVFDAIREVKCPQKEEGEEDCLVINVFTPMEVNSALPVLVYFHGGSFLMGSGPTRGMEPLVKQNVIVVTLNYRLGALGFLCLGIRDAPGNAGLKDQVAALQWVQKNIHFFYGNPKQVTIYGMSAGGASVEYLVLSKMTKGLFSQAIVESASATAVWASDPNPTRTARIIAGLMGFTDTRFMEVLVDYYKDMQVDILTETNYEYYSNLTDGSFGFVPCVEKKIKNIGRVVSENAHKLLLSGRFRKTPMMFMYTSLEGLHLRSSEYDQNSYKKRMEISLEDFIPADLKFSSDKIKKDIAVDINKFYFHNGSIDFIPYLQYFGDYLVLYPLWHSVEEHSAATNHASLYLMEFGYKGELGGDDKHPESAQWAGHGDIVKYIITNKKPRNYADSLTVRRMSTMIANYVKYGNPTPSENPLLPIIWPSTKPGNITYLYYDQDLKLYTNPYERRITFWDKLYAKFRRKTWSRRFRSD